MRDRKYQYGSHSVGRQESLVRRPSTRPGHDTAKLAKQELKLVRPLFWFALGLALWILLASWMAFVA